MPIRYYRRCLKPPKRPDRPSRVPDWVHPKTKASLCKTGFDGIHGNLNAIREVKLLHDQTQVLLNRPSAQIQLGANFFVRETLGDKPQDSDVPLGELLAKVRLVRFCTVQRPRASRGKLLENPCRNGRAASPLTTPCNRLRSCREGMSFKI